jgi:hypothetical protein
MAFEGIESRIPLGSRTRIVDVHSECTATGMKLLRSSLAFDRLLVVASLRRQL